MGVSKHRKGHREKVAKYKINIKIAEKARKKKLIEEYIKMQQELMASREAHTSTEEVIGPDVNVDELNEDWDSVDLSNVEIISEDVVPVVEDNSVIETKSDLNDNNN
jgi:hypothetical protein